MWDKVDHKRLHKGQRRVFWATSKETICRVKSCERGIRVWATRGAGVEKEGRCQARRPRSGNGNGAGNQEEKKYNTVEWGVTFTLTSKDFTSERGEVHL